MFKNFLIVQFLLICCLHISAQITNVNGSYTTGNSMECGRLKCVEIRNDGVIVTIEVKALKALERLSVYSSDNTFIELGGVKVLQLTGLLVNDHIESVNTGDNWGWNKVKAGETNTFDLYFQGSIPSGVTSFSIVDEGDSYGAHGYSFRNYKILNPRKNYVDISSEYAVKHNVDSNDDGICGIYEPINASGAIIACIKYNGAYKLIYVSCPSNYSARSLWNIGDIKANLEQTSSGIMKAEWYGALKSIVPNSYVAFDGSSMKVIVNGESMMYLKTYPHSSNPTTVGVGSTEEWTGTGFALNNGYIVTNNHVVENSKSIVVVGINGNHNIEYRARSVMTDKKNDLALIKIEDDRFTGFTNVPYAVSRRQCEVGEDVFVLGYPLTSYMGEEIKLTNGIISSRSGYQGDITTYQISAPVQPGNSGGPMFDKNGNVVGIVNSGVPGAENVGYAIKSTYLFNLVSSIVPLSNIPQTNHVQGTSLSEKVKSVKNCVFYIKCRGN